MAGFGGFGGFGVAPAAPPAPAAGGFGGFGGFGAGAAAPAGGGFGGFGAPAPAAAPSATDADASCPIPPGTDSISTLNFSRDGRFLSAGTWDNKARLPPPTCCARSAAHAHA
jgi:hypothetical protein